jgi:hypothetical protein
MQPERSTFRGERFTVNNYVFNFKEINMLLKLLDTVQNVKLLSMYNILAKNK